MPSRNTLANQTYNAIKWNYLGNITQLIFQFSIGIILARLLGPEPFGTVAIAWLIISIGKVFGDLGFSSALIQKQVLTTKDINFVFTIQTIIGLILTSICFFSAELTSEFFNKPNASDAIRFLSWIFLIQALGQTPTSILQKTLHFKLTQIANIVSYIIGYVFTGLPVAYLGYGVWSLVAAQLVQTACYTTLVLFYSKLKIRPTLAPSSSGFLNFGTKVIAANFCNWCLSNLDATIIGRYLGATDLGVYNRTMTLVATPMNAITNSIQRVLFSSSSKSQDNLQKIRIGYLAATELIAYICFPIFFIIASIPETIILGFYGENWKAAIPILVPLALSMPLNSLLALAGPVLMALNKTEKEIKSQFYLLILMIPTILLAAKFSLEVISWSILFIYAIRWFLLEKAICKELNINFIKIINALLIPLFISILISLFAKITLMIVVFSNNLYNIIWSAASSIIIMAIILRAIGPRLFRGAIGEILRERSILPKRISAWLRYPEKIS